MTAIVAWKASTPEPSVQVATDTFAFTPSGRLSVSKVSTLPHMNAFLVVQGPIAVQHALALAISAKTDDLAVAERALSSLLYEVREDLGEKLRLPCEALAVLGGIDERGNRYLASAATMPYAKIRAYQLRNAESFHAYPSDAATVAAMGIPADTDDIRPEDAVRFIRAQRDSGIDGDAVTAKEGIGGAVVWTGVFRDRIEQRVVGTVDDTTELSQPVTVSTGGLSGGG